MERRSKRKAVDKNIIMDASDVTTVLHFMEISPNARFRYTRDPNQVYFYDTEK